MGIKFYRCCSFPWFSIGYDPTNKGHVYKYLWRCQKRIPTMKTILFDHSGPMIRYDVKDGALHIEDLNPSMATKWAMSRWEMIRTGWRFIMAGLSRG